MDISNAVINSQQRRFLPNTCAASNIQVMKTRKPLTVEQRGDAERLMRAWLAFKRKTNMSQQELASRCGWQNQSAVSQYLRGIIPLNLEALLKISKVIGAQPEVISPSLGKVVSMARDARYDENLRMPNFEPRRVPLIDYVQAGVWRNVTDPYSIGAAENWIPVHIDKLGPHAFALQIVGESMLPEFREGDVIVVDPAVKPLPGDFVVAKNGSNEATFKKFRPRGVNETGDSIFELVPLNEDYATLRSDTTPIEIIGTMIEHRRIRRR